MKKLIAKFSTVASLCERRLRRSQTAATSALTVFVAAAVVCAACQSQAALVTFSTSTPVGIPDNSPLAGAASGIYVDPSDSQFTGLPNPYVTSVASVVFTITGGWDSDFTLVLKHIDGGVSQSVTLFSGLPYANGGFNNVTVTSGSTSLTGASSSYTTTPITGTIGGVNFSPFVGASATGDWILYATDNSAGYNGTLTGWTLNVEAVPEPVNVALGVFGGALGLAVLRKKLKFGKLENVNRD